jgi:hypothetical protein
MKYHQSSVRSVQRSGLVVKVIVVCLLGILTYNLIMAVTVAAETISKL